jgi:hypothetical protein
MFSSAVCFQTPFACVLLLGFIYSFICLFVVNDTVSSSDSVTSHYRMTTKEVIGKDVEESSCVLVLVTVLELVWRDSRKP